MRLCWTGALVLASLPLLTHSDTSSPSPASVASQAACTSLKLSLGPQIVQVSGEEYQAGISSAWNQFNTEFHPTCIVFPTNSGHVQTAMRAIFVAESDYAVQAGGHSAMLGWNNIQDGVLIHFLNMQNVSYDPDRDSITLEPGINWEEAVAAVEPFGVAPMGGRINDVGTGLLLGGGLSFLAAAHGYSADAYKELDVVLVSGDMVTATSTNQYADLFQALKGGANRFGIVTRYELDAVHTGTNEDKTWFGGSVFWDSSNAELLLNATAHYVRDTKDPKTGILVGFANIVTGGSITAVVFAYMFYNGPELPESVFGEFLSVPSISASLGPASYFEVANTIIDNMGGNASTGQLFGASALSSDEELYLDAFTNWNNFTETFKDDLSSVVLAFTPVLESQIIAGREKGGNAIDPPLEAYNAVQFQVTFPAGITAAEVPDDLERGRQLLFEKVPRSSGLPLYINECDVKQNVFETYGTYEFLKGTYAKYDPTRFNMRHTNGPPGL